jgi:L-alanine-DL-glutamate epimerase-like enolase superfamily enzyme
MSAASIITRVECFVLRAPIARPVANAFGAMTSRPAVFLRIDASDGCWGWGEVFSNFPPGGAEHRARLVASIFAPLLRGTSDEVAGVRALLASRTRQMAIQCGEPGPFAQISGAVDQALWDLAARRVNLPLWKLLGAAAGGPVRVYASGIGPDEVASIARTKRDEGYRAWKLKVGFGRERDLGNLAALRELLGDDATIMTDANQAWSAADAAARIAELAPFRPHWIEEPMAADEPLAAWQALGRASAVPLAAGENIRGHDAFAESLAARFLRFVQPDVGKWGGISGAREVAAMAAARGAALCPHWLAGGVGLAASLHLLAVAGTADSWMEVDANPNPLREEVCPLAPVEGGVTLSTAPGLGVEPDLVRLARYRVTID